MAKNADKTRNSLGESIQETEELGILAHLVIDNETEHDFREVEELTREAFWNQHAPGCDEHYLVHVLRTHPNYIKDLDLIARIDGDVVGNIMYSKAQLINEAGEVKDILTFGPLSVHPKWQRKGVGKALQEESFRRALNLGYDTVVIFGHPGNYVKRGFVSCLKHNISLEGSIFPTAMLVKVLKESDLDNHKWVYHESNAFCIDEDAAAEFDRTFPFKERKYQNSQEEFYIYSHSALHPDTQVSE